MISPDRLERYKDFIDRHKNSEENYDPDLGLGGLLSILTPDAKAITLYSIPLETPFFSGRQLYGNVLHFLEGLGLPRRFPLIRRSLWNYCYYPQLRGGEGSFVSIGEVVREMEYQTAEGMKTAYLISSAGNDLAKPLVVNVAEWIDYAQKSNIPHRFDSMWKVLGSVDSKTDNRRPLAIYRVIEHLVQNPSYQRCQDLQEVLKGEVNYTVISDILNSLGQTGIINYDSPAREIEGKRSRGWSTYSLVREVDYQETLDKIKRIRSSFNTPGYLKLIRDYINENPSQTYELNNLSQKLGINKNNVSYVLSLLQGIGVLKNESSFKGGQVQSKAKANELTRAFYDMVLLPAQETAQTLQPAHNRPLTAHLARVILGNYQNERTHIGPEGGEEVRDIILGLLTEHGEMKLSYIKAEGNKRLDRELTGGAWRGQLRNLIERGEIEKVEKGVYRLAGRPVG